MFAKLGGARAAGAATKRVRRAYLPGADAPRPRSRDVARMLSTYQCFGYIAVNKQMKVMQASSSKETA